MKRTLAVMSGLAILSALAPAQSFLTATWSGGNDVKLWDRTPTATHAFKFTEAGSGGVSVALGHYNNDSMPDYLITGATNANGHVILYDGKSRRPIQDFQAFPGFTGGANVAAGDVNGDGFDDILVGGNGPNCPVKIFNGINLAVLHNFLAYPGFSGGVRVAAGDVNGDGTDDVIIAPGPGRPPHVDVYNGLNGNPIFSFDAFAPTFTGGITIACGDINGDGRGDIVVGAGAEGAPSVKVFSGVDLAVLQNFFAFEPTFMGGVNVATGDVSGDGKADIMVGSGSGGNSVKIFDGVSLAVINNWMPEGASYTNGFSVAATDKPGTLDFGFYLNKDTVAGQNSVLGSVFTNMPVGSNTVFTTYDNTSLVTTPASATITNGQSFKNFQITTTAITSTINVMLFAKLNTVVQSRALTLAPLVPTSISFMPSTVQGGQSSDGRIVVNGVAGPGGRVISIVENSAFVTCPTSVTVPPGGTDVHFPITTTAVATTQNVPIKAIVSAGQTTATFRVTH